MRTTPISAFIALGVLILSTIFACLRTYAWSSRVLGSTANGPFTGHLRWWHSCKSALHSFKLPCSHFLFLGLAISAVITAFALIEVRKRRCFSTIGNPVISHSLQFALSLWIIIVLNRTYGWATHALGDQTRLLWYDFSPTKPSI